MNIVVPRSVISAVIEAHYDDDGMALHKAITHLSDVTNHDAFMEGRNQSSCADLPGQEYLPLKNIVKGDF